MKHQMARRCSALLTSAFLLIGAQAHAAEPSPEAHAEPIAANLEIAGPQPLPQGGVERSTGAGGDTGMLFIAFGGVGVLSSGIGTIGMLANPPTDEAGELSQVVAGAILGVSVVSIGIGLLVNATSDSHSAYHSSGRYRVARKPNYLRGEF